MASIDYLPQQDVAQRQYFTGIGEYTAQYQTSNVNAIRHKLINQVKTRPAWELNSYQSWYDSYDTGIENFSAFKKREWFVECVSTNWNIVLDEEVFEWNRWYLVTNPVYDRVRLEVECNSVINTTACDEFLDGECKDRKKLDRRTSWSFQDICWTWDVEYDFNSCTWQKFAKTYGPKGKPIAFTKWKIRHDIVGNQVFSTIVADINVPSWSWAYFNYSSNPNIVVGYMRQVRWTYEYENWTSWIWLDWFHYWLDQWTTEITKDANWNTINTFKKFSNSNSTYIEQWDVEIWFFEEVWDTLSFSTANGAVQIHWGNCDEYYSTFYPWTHTYSIRDGVCDKWTGSVISSFFTFAWKNWFMKWGLMFLAEWGNDFWLFIWATFNLTEEYNDFVEVGQYWYLLGPRSMSILYRAFTNTWQVVYQLITTDNWLWYFNRYSYIKHRGWFYIATADDEWRPVVSALYVNPFDRGGWYFSFDIGYSTISKWRANQDFHMINKRRWDVLTMSTKWNELLMFANNWRRPWTKLFIYDTDDKFRHIRNICWKNLRGYKDCVWFDNNISINKWQTDWWEDITWIKWFMFWQTSTFSPKWITWMYMSVNYESVITDKSWIRIDMDFNGYSRSKRMPIRSTYTNNLWRLRGTWISDEKDREALKLEWMSLDLMLMWGNALWKAKDVELELYKDLDTYCSYTYKWIKECISLCLDENCPKNNILDPENNSLITVSKFANLYMHIGDEANKIYVEFVDEWTDDISLNWYELQWQFIQRDNLVISQNVLTVNNLVK